MTEGQHIIARAKAFAAHHAALAIPSKVERPVADGPSPVARRIADDMLDIAGTSACVVEEDLLLRGWNREDLRVHGAEAREIANAVAERSAQ
ncbi:hypothetical protein [Aureimonas phyllosphaerae]|uniref:Uncharacterized protein n=1 Tax=Aureimonas phyllosphaerae TaxID=1166078 RepID=A0A7W6FWH1_9HYPH|nr:hypothetical protein [Aureimonas phyllosphaerae]MBB3937905.1 hypothetical protein [Aureimonas phyllosphaerae]MBB3961922.1 hypothetical protein [Aureimonas phyllosphaerae]SFF54717.1 hypothetical protein SAMN05216566_12549 [Aureimonas phyllosphaerae]